jgi:hypothetical protein
MKHSSTTNVKKILRARNKNLNLTQQGRSANNMQRQGQTIGLANLKQDKLNTKEKP